MTFDSISCRFHQVDPEKSFFLASQEHTLLIFDRVIKWEYLVKILVQNSNIDIVKAKMKWLQSAKMKKLQSLRTSVGKPVHSRSEFPSSYGFSGRLAQKVRSCAQKSALDNF